VGSGEGTKELLERPVRDLRTLHPPQFIRSAEVNALENPDVDNFLGRVREVAE
jgi:hypothetical protein